MIFLELRCYIQDVLVSGQRHGERVAVDDAVQRELVHLVWVSHGDDVAHLLNNILHDSRAFRVNDPFGAARQPVDLPLRVPARANRHDLLHAGHVLAPTVLHGFSQVLQAHHRGTVVSATLIVRRRFKVLCQVGSEALTARKVGGDDAEDPPPTLTALWIRALVIGSLFHQLTINLVTQLLIFVTMLWTRTKTWFC